MRMGVRKGAGDWRAVLCTGLLCLIGSTGSATQTLRLSTGELPPYATRERADDGIALNIVRKAFSNAGYAVQYTFKPWTRSLEEARVGLFDGTAYWGKSPERDAGFLISDNVMTEQWLFMYRDRPGAKVFDWESLADLKGQRIAVVQSYTYTPEFWALQKSGVLTVEVAQDDLSNLRRMVAGRVDVTLIERNVACYLMNEHFTRDEVASLHAHPRLLTNQFTTHLMLSNKIPESADRMKAFNLGLAQLKKSKDYAAMLRYPECSLALPNKS